MSGVLMNGSGKVLLKDGGAVLRKPYLKSWGYAQAKADGTTELYDWVFKCFSEGFSVSERTIDGSTYAVDGGAAGEEYEGFRKIVVPLIQFQIPAESYLAVWDCLDRVVRYNWELCYHVKNQEFLDEDGNNARETGKTIVSVAMIVPNDTQRLHAQTKMAEATALVKAKVLEVCGVSAGDGLTEVQKRNVTKVIHDWIMERTSYKPTENEQDDEYYWSQLAYSALTDEENIKPVCAGYTAAVAYLCSMYGITAVFVSGEATDGVDTGQHAWNMVAFGLPYGVYSSVPSDWAAIDLTWDDKRHDGTKEGTPWEYFCTDKAYHEYGTAEETRTNDDRGYPVSVPTATCAYTGNTLYGIAESDWKDGDSQ